MIESLLQFDETIFNWINQGLSNPVFDLILPILRNKLTWVPLYIFIAAFALINLKWKGVWLIFCLLIVVGISDSLSSKLIKPTVDRLRPCKTEHLQDQLILRARCGSGYSFTSSHATNHFAVAVFLIFALATGRRKLKWVLIFWAGSISFSQIYVGVHFPFDVLGGALLGSLVGYAFGHYYLKKATHWFRDDRHLPNIT